MGVLTVSDIAERLKVKRQAVHNYIKDGELRATKRGSVYLVTEEDFESFVRERQERLYRRASLLESALNSL